MPEGWYIPRSLNVCFLGYHGDRVPFLSRGSILEWVSLLFMFYYLTSVSLAEKAKCFIARTSNRVLRFQMKQDRLHYIFRAFTL